MDIKTVLFSYLVSNAICAAVILSLWIQNRKQFNGLGFWLADYIMQFTGLALVTMRGRLPDFVSVVVGSGLTIGGTLLLYIGLERFLGKRSSQIHNYAILTLFVALQTWFGIVHPSLTARNINLALALIALCSQCAWLMFRRVDPDLRFATRAAGYVFMAYVAVNLARAYVDFVIPTGDDFFASNLYDTVMVMTYQMLFIGLTFSLFMMVNRRLSMNLRGDIASRKRAEEALRVSEEKFSKAFHSSPDSVMISRLSDGKIMEVNEGFSRATGYSRSAALGSTSVTLQLWANPHDRESFVQTLQKEHTVRNVEYNFRAKSGAILNGLLSADIIELENEPHIVSVIHDITERKRTEEALERSQGLYQDLVERQAIGVYRIHVQKHLSWASPDEPHYEYEFMNDEYCRLTGKSREEHLADPSLTLKMIHPEDYPSFARKNEEADITNDPFVWEGRMIVRGETRWVHYESCSRQLSDKGVVWTGILMDVTERKQAESALRASEERFRQFIMSAPDVVLGVDQEGKITFANMEATNLFGYSHDEIVGMEVEKLVPLKLREAHVFNRAKYMDAPQTRSMKSLLDLIAVCKDGSEIPVDIKLSPVTIDSGTQLVAFMREISERKIAESALLKLTTFEERQRLARDLHDSVNQSIHSLVLFSETLVSTLEKNNGARSIQIAKRLEESARQALKEVRLMLYEFQSPEMEREINFIQDLETRLSTVERRAGVRAQVIQEGTMEYCPRAWYGNLFWITIEALNNALKHAQARKMVITIKCFPQYLDLEVVDDGIGFDPAEVRSGGLGLRNIRERADLIGGELTIESSPGKGTRVFFHAGI